MANRLSESQLSDISHQLSAQRQEILEHMRQQLHDTEEAQRFDRWTQLNDPGDYSVADLMRDMELEQLDRETEQLAANENALVRIRKGSYGECADCGIDIKVERLLAQPTASRCLECQAKYEREHETRVGSSSSM